MNQTEIINAALSFLGEETLIVNPSQTNYPTPFCKQKYEEALNEMFWQTYWDFAQMIVKLNESAVMPETFMDMYAYAYVRPQNACLIRAVDKKDILSSILLSKQDIPVKDFREVDDGEGGIIVLSNIEDACCLHTNKIANTSLYSIDFCNTLTYGTAVKIAPRINAKKLNDSIQMYNYYLGVAVENTLNRQKDLVSKKQQSKYMRARYGIR